MGIFDERTPLKLDPEKLGLTDPDQLRMARAIAAATEATRVALRADDFFASLEFRVGGFGGVLAASRYAAVVADAAC